MLTNIPVQIIKEKKGYSAIALGIEGICCTQADTYEKVIQNIKEAISLHLEGLAEIDKRNKTKRIRKESVITMVPVYA